MARSFNGSTDKIDCGTQALLSPTTGGYTYAGWVYLAANPTGYNAAFGSYPNNLGIFVKVGGSKIACYIGGFLIYDATGIASLSNLTWYHLAVTYDVPTLTGVGYVNGVFDGSGASTAAGINGLFTIGGPQGNVSWNGRLADVAAWNVVLTAAEIAALAQGARPYTIRRGSLQGYWPVDGISSPEPDLSGNIFNGTVTGTALADGPPIAMFTPRWPNNELPQSTADTIKAISVNMANMRRRVTVIGA